ncbi:Hypothetical predicted protein [Marmota monax]|uniref:Uncharacterized protein n=1 Tax=Marmota monax TaxID=9995 RepID=A0A5E4ASM6_MARMO|nr:Hypothetical predicted protein [Marmota monax]
MHNTVGGAMTGPGAHQLGSTRMPNHDTSVVIQQAMPSPQSSSVITQAPSTNRQIGSVYLEQEEELSLWVHASVFSLNFLLTNGYGCRRSTVESETCRLGYGQNRGDDESNRTGFDDSDNRSQSLLDSSSLHGTDSLFMDGQSVLPQLDTVWDSVYTVFLQDRNRTTSQTEENNKGK